MDIRPATIPRSNGLLQSERHLAERGRSTTSSITVMSNRLPVHRSGSGSTAHWESSAGGLVTALGAVFRQCPGMWIGWPGNQSIVRPFMHDGIRIKPIRLTRDDEECFYHGMANRTLWPLYHDAIRPPEFHRAWWECYRRINLRFARAAAAGTAHGGVVWIHDFHLQLVPAMLRKLRPDLRIGFFLHIPFPPEELFEWLPWRSEVLRGLLGADVVGFQAQKAARNFSRLCRDYAGAAGSDTNLQYEGRQISVRAYPISIDFDWFDIRARNPETRERVNALRRWVGEKRKIMLAIDRLDYTKGVVDRLNAFEELLQRGVVSVDDCVLVQIATPSRESVPDYLRLRNDVERTVGRINGKFSEPGRVAVHYFRRNLTREELVAYYGAADVMVVTPLRDGMNLVAKEYVACRPDNTGVLVLSQFAGAARELTRALTVNPRDQSQFVRVLGAALKTSPDSARMRMRILRSRVKRHDVYAWCDEFLDTLMRK